MPDLGKSTNLKIQAIRDWLKVQGIPSLEDWLDRFAGQQFEGSTIDKASLFKKLLSIKGVLTEEQEKFIDARVGTGRLLFYKGRRTTKQYASNLAVGWIVEDVLREAFAERGIVITDTGDDREREYLAAPSADADWNLNGSPVELYVDFLGTWRSQGFVDLKAGKMTRLKAGKLTILCYDLGSGEWFLIERSYLDSLGPCGIPSRHNQAMDGKETWMVPLPAWPIVAEGPGEMDRFKKDPDVSSLFDSLIRT
jgi:hypothetical protein